MGVFIGVLVAGGVLAVWFGMAALEDTKFWQKITRIKERIAYHLMPVIFVGIILAIGGLIGWLGTRH